MIIGDDVAQSFLCMDRFIMNQQGRIALADSGSSVPTLFRCTLELLTKETFYRLLNYIFRMKKIFRNAFTLLLLGGLTACSHDAALEDSFNSNDHQFLKRISISAEDFQTESGARSTVQIDQNGVQFLWSATDTVGIFPNEGSQVEFPIDEGVGMQTATFDGGGWALKHSSTYSAYYPYDFYNRNMTAIPVSYAQQQQEGNASTSHLGAYDFMATTVVTPTNGSLEFSLQHLGCLVMLRTTMEEAKTLTGVTLQTDEEEFTISGVIDLTAQASVITPTLSTHTLSVDLKNFEVGEDGTATIYFMMAPADLSDDTLEITLSDTLGAYMKYQVAGKNMVAGKAYAYQLTEGELVKRISYQTVDLGLPSGTLWADRNVGAATPEAFGDTFGWGETEPRTKENMHLWSNYKFSDGSTIVDDREIPHLTKYCYDEAYGTVDNKMTLELVDDAAYVNMGVDWRMPTVDEMNELSDQCTWTWTIQNGVNGFQVTGPNGNSIFFPASVGTGSTRMPYWSSSLYPHSYTDYAWAILLVENQFYVSFGIRRDVQVVRAVKR